ncbi:HIT domain-containing protein [Streptomyces caniscabiei]|uniref:HIT family protein n=1 Tax=Streptomyces caniscabiei TaxID=2746961 RepID=UPI0029B62D83|nr:HIT domain-containing protein [Streptomyces caniscabiei]MDX2776426.1 HIT domain-containing protein [Streptomyces caniscabiei]
MHSHQPDDYVCPFCDWLSGKETEYKQNSDIIYQDNEVTAFVAPKWWVNNPGHVLVIPNQHHENIYTIPDEALHATYSVAKKAAIALRNTYDSCTGTSTRQHNEPDGNQDVWHFHVHVYPRYKDDRLYQNHDNKMFVGSEDRKEYAETLRQYFNTQFA